MPGLPGGVMRLAGSARLAHRRPATCVSSARRRRAPVAEAASLSRLYAGIHYRFDMDAGLAPGRAAASLALAADLHDVAPLP